MRTLFFALVAAFVLAGPVLAQEPVKPGKEHAFLAETEGEWTVKFLSPGGDMVGKSVNKMTLGGLWLSCSLEAKMPQGEFTGQGLDGYDPVKKKYVSIWVDSMSASPILFEGDRSEDGKTLTMTGKGPGPDGKPTEYKSTTEYVSKDKHVFKLWMGNLTGEPMLTGIYERKK